MNDKNERYFCLGETFSCFQLSPFRKQVIFHSQPMLDQILFLNSPVAWLMFTYYNGLFYLCFLSENIYRITIPIMYESST